MNNITSIQFISRWIPYVLLYLGIGLIAGAVIHIPVFGIKSLFIGLIGFICVCSSFLYTEKKTHPEYTYIQLLMLIPPLFLLSSGIGMLSGGVQHFADFPLWASKIIPIGVLSSLLGYALYYKVKPTHTYAFIAITLIIAAVLYYLLDTYAAYSILHNSSSHNH